jgi:exosortase/archaeosortase family protein
LIWGTSLICEVFNLRYLTNDTAIRIIGHGGIKIVYSCLGYGIISVLIAFSIAIPYQKIKQRLTYLFISIFLFSILNMIRLFVVSYYARQAKKMNIDHHDVFNWLCYLLILVGMFFWMKKSLKNTATINQNE